LEEFNYSVKFSAVTTPPQLL